MHLLDYQVHYPLVEKTIYIVLPWKPLIHLHIQLIILENEVRHGETILDNLKQAVKSAIHAQDRQTTFLHFRVCLRLRQYLYIDGDTKTSSLEAIGPFMMCSFGICISKNYFWELINHEENVFHFTAKNYFTSLERHGGHMDFNKLAKQFLKSIEPHSSPIRIHRHIAVN